MKRHFLTLLVMTALLAPFTPSAAHAAYERSACATEQVDLVIPLTQLLDRHASGTSIMKDEFYGAGLCFHGELAADRGYTLAQKFALDRAVPDFKGHYVFFGKKRHAFGLVQPNQIPGLDLEIALWNPPGDDARTARLCSIALNELKSYAQTFVSDIHWFYFFDAATDTYSLYANPGETAPLPVWAYNPGDSQFPSEVQVKKDAQTGSVTLVHTSKKLNRYLICAFRPWMND